MCRLQQQFIFDSECLHCCEARHIMCVQLLVVHPPACGQNNWFSMTAARGRLSKRSVRHLPICEHCHTCVSIPRENPYTCLPVAQSTTQIEVSPTQAWAFQLGRVRKEVQHAAVLI